MQIDFIEPWVAVGSKRASLEEELRRELSPDSVLSASILRAIGRRIDCDDVLFEVCDEKVGFKLVIVHLTWSSRIEVRTWPIANLFADAGAFINQMRLDAQNYN